MLKINVKVAFIVFFATHSTAAFASTVNIKAEVPRRISSQYIDMGKPQTIYMVPGMATLIELPTPIHQVRVGNSDDIQYTKPDQPENEITLFLKSAQAKPTNLFLISGKSKYIFDIVPSKSIHQDYVEVVGFYGGPELGGTSYVTSQIIDSSDLPEKREGKTLTLPSKPDQKEERK